MGVMLEEAEEPGLGGGYGPRLSLRGKEGADSSEYVYEGGLSK